MAGIFFLTGCHSDQEIPDVSYLDGKFQLIRTEQTLFSMDTTLSDADAQSRFKPYQRFWDLYFKKIMPSPGDSVADWKFLAGDPYLRAIRDSVSLQYQDMDDIREQLSTAFQFLQYYFPGNRVPNVYTLISGFGYFPFIFDDGERDGIGISLEMFLGSKFPYQKFAGNVPVFSEYLVRTYNRAHLVKRTMDVIVDDIVGPPAGERLLDLMIHNGIKLYILEHLMPTVSDTVLFEFTPDQLAWCQNNERDLWAHFLSEDLLYSTETTKIQKLVSPAPAIPGMPKEAPGGVANWTGWRIIHALMKADPSLKMTDLLVMHDTQALLERARYRPR